MKRRTSFAERPLWYRAGYGAVLAVAGLGIPVLILLGLALFGGRFQTMRGGGELDAWLAAAVYPAGLAIAGAVAGVAGPWLRRDWQAAVTGCLAALPLFALLSLTADPHGPEAYTVRWGLAAFCALVLGGPVGVTIFRGNTARRQRRGARRGGV